MKIMKAFLTLLFCTGVLTVSAQNYVSRVSPDSVSILKSRVDALKSAIKLNQLKLNEADHEADIEKQKAKIIELNGSEKAAAKESSRMSDALQAGTETDLKKVEKLSKKATSSAKDLKNALDKLRKQIDNVEQIRTEIQDEERKLANHSPSIIYKN